MNMYNPHELYHHGILGMKWGVRRFQNKDGTLTPAGKKRKARLEKKLEKTVGRKEPKNPNIMSDEEIQARINRLRLEKDLADAELNLKSSEAKLHPPEVNKGKEFAKTAGKEIWDKIVQPVAKDALKAAAGKFMKDKFGIDINGGSGKSEHDRLKEQAEALLYKQQIRDRAKDLYGDGSSSAKEQSSAGSSSKNDSKESNSSNEKVPSGNDMKGQKQTKAEKPLSGDVSGESMKREPTNKRGPVIDVDYKEVAPATKEYVSREASKSYPTLLKEYKEPINTGRTYANEFLALPPSSGDQYASLREIAKKHGVTGLRY